MQGERYECPNCMDGLLFTRGECPTCGAHWRRERQIQRKGRRWEQQVKERVLSSEFQNLVGLARETLDVSPQGLPAAEFLSLFLSMTYAIWWNYHWSLETVQRMFLPLKGDKEAMVKHLRSLRGKHAETEAEYILADGPRAQMVDWLLRAKLISCRLSSILGIDNVSEVFVYLVCPELAPPESWKLRPTTDEDPFLRQLLRLIRALFPLLPKEDMSDKAIRTYFDASAKYFHDTSKGETTWEEERAALHRFSPFFFDVNYPDALRMRARRAMRSLPDFRESQLHELLDYLFGSGDVSQ